jgi:hypothetical protein
VASTSWPVGAGTRVVNDPQYERNAASWAAPGVVGVPTDTAVVYADGTGTRTPKIRANKYANLRGWAWHSGTADFALPSLAANASGSDRFDTVVLRFSRSTYTVVEAVVQGANGGAAGAASLTQSIAEPLTSGTFEIPLAVVRVGPGATAIAAGDVTPCAWYTSGDAVVTNVGSFYQPAANLGFTRLRHADVGVTYVPYSGAWRRMDWGSPWGIIGGQRWNGSGGITGAFPGAAWTDVGLRTGSQSLLAGRRYMIEYGYSLGFSTAGDGVTMYHGVGVRKADGTTVVGEHVYPTFPVWAAWHFWGAMEYEPASNETINFQLWSYVAKLSGTLYFAQLQRGAPTFFRVRDDGRAGIDVNVP